MQGKASESWGSYYQVSKLIFQSYHPNTVGSKTSHVGAYLPIDELAELSKKRMKAYAESIGADYICQEKPNWTGVRAHPAWTRWAMFDLWDQYDEMCYVDCDILPTPDAFGVSIFDFEGVGKFTERPPGSKETWHVNAGVFKVTQQEALRLKNAINNKKYVKMLETTGKNQEAFNQAFKKTFGRKPSGLDPRWNSTRPHHREDGCYLWHLIGHQKLKTGNAYGNIYGCKGSRGWVESPFRWSLEQEGIEDWHDERN